MVNQGRVFPEGVFGMTRDEQMWEAVAQEHGDLSMRDALVTLTAMEWADKTMIEKSCQWILNNMHKYIKAKRLGIFVNNTGMASDFRKAMEE